MVYGPDALVEMLMLSTHLMPSCWNGSSAASRLAGILQYLASTSSGLVRSKAVLPL